MKSLFINTSSFFMSLAILEDNEVLYQIEEEILVDMASKIVPALELAFNNVSFELKDIDKIFVVNGPGSFTGVRVGVTVAKTIGWALNKDIIPLSSLEVLATTSTTSDYVVSAIDARRGFVFAGVYDHNLNIIMADNYMPLEDLNKYLEKGTIVSYDRFENSIRPKINISKIVEKHADDYAINAHALKPNYLKLTEAEEKKKEQGQ